MPLILTIKAAAAASIKLVAETIYHYNPKFSLPGNTGRSRVFLSALFCSSLAIAAARLSEESNDRVAVLRLLGMLLDLSSGSDSPYSARSATRPTLLVLVSRARPTDFEVTDLRGLMEARPAGSIFFSTTRPETIRLLPRLMAGPKGVAVRLMEASRCCRRS